MKEIEGKLIFSSVAEDSSGIHLRLATEDGKIEIVFLEVNKSYGDLNLILKNGMNPKEEMQKVCNLLNGFHTLEDGTVYPLPNHIQKNIKLIIDGDSQ
jgi:hypothetical protein